MEPRIPRRSNAIETQSKDFIDLKPGILPVVRYQPANPLLSAEEVERDAGIALTNSLGKLPPNLTVLQQAVAAAAVAKLKRAVVNYPNDGEAWLALSLAQQRQGDNPGRLHSAQQAVLCEPTAETYLAVRFDAEAGNRQYDAALATLQQLITLHPTTTKYRQLLASLHIARKDWSAGEAAATAALKINPLSAEALVLRAICREQLGRQAKAKIDSTAALELQTQPEIQAQYRQWLRQRR